MQRREDTGNEIHGNIYTRADRPVKSTTDPLARTVTAVAVVDHLLTDDQQSRVGALRYSSA